MKIVRRLGKFVQKITSGLRGPDERFVREGMLGIIRRGSTMLTEIGRALGEQIPLQKTVNRLSRMASSKYFDDERLRRNFLAEVAPLTRGKLSVVAVDLTEIAKPYGKKMEDLCLVRDGSSRRGGVRRGRSAGGSGGRESGLEGCAGDSRKSRSRRGGSVKKADIVPGYWVLMAVATGLEQHVIVPLLSEVFSTETPLFKSVNDVIEKWLRYLAPFISERALWLFDRGFDGKYILNVLCDLRLRWVVRMVGRRKVEFQEESREMKRLAAGIVLPYTTVVKTRGKGSRDKMYSVRFGFIPVHVKGIPQQRGLIVAHMGRSQRIMLLCWRLPANAKEAAVIVRAYLRRWGAEDSARAAKQICGMEDVRVQTLRAVARLVRLASMALAWLNLLTLWMPVTATKLLAMAKTVGKKPLLLVYRLAEGVRNAG